LARQGGGPGCLRQFIAITTPRKQHVGNQQCGLRGTQQLNSLGIIACGFNAKPCVIENVANDRADLRLIFDKQDQWRRPWHIVPRSARSLGRDGM
jgi:hypothetical protein